MNYATKEDLENLKKEILEAINKTKSEPKKEVWELYPDYKSCVKDEDSYYTSLSGQILSLSYNSGTYIATSEKLAKRQLAELQLYAIAEKWGEGIEIEDYCYRVITNNGGRMMVDKLPITSYYFNSLSFHFKNEQQASKSIELHHQLWKDYFMID